MTKFILHGGFPRKENELNRSFYEEFVSDIPDGGTILLVYFASSNDKTEVFKEQSRKFTEQAKGKKFTFIHATKEDFLGQVRQSDAIYFHGGSTNKLLGVLRAYPDLTQLTEGKTIAGSSAGAYAIAKFGASHSEDELREGLGLVPVRVVCHYESSEEPPAAGAISILENTAQDLELVFLRDCEWKVLKSS